MLAEPTKLDMYKYSVWWYYTEYRMTRQLVDSRWTRKLLSIHGTVKNVVKWLRKKNELFGGRCK